MIPFTDTTAPIVDPPLGAKSVNADVELDSANAHRQHHRQRWPSGQRVTIWGLTVFGYDPKELTASSFTAYALKLSSRERSVHAQGNASSRLLSLCVAMRKPLHRPTPNPGVS